MAVPVSCLFGFSFNENLIDNLTVNGSLTFDEELIEKSFSFINFGMYLNECINKERKYNKYLYDDKIYLNKCFDEEMNLLKKVCEENINNKDIKKYIRRIEKDSKIIKNGYIPDELIIYIFKNKNFDLLDFIIEYRFHDIYDLFKRNYNQKIFNYITNDIIYELFIYIFFHRYNHLEDEIRKIFTRNYYWIPKSNKELLQLHMSNYIYESLEMDKKLDSNKSFILIKNKYQSENEKLLFYASQGDIENLKQLLNKKFR